MSTAPATTAPPNPALCRLLCTLDMALGDEVIFAETPRDFRNHQLEDALHRIIRDNQLVVVEACRNLFYDCINTDQWAQTVTDELYDAYECAMFAAHDLAQPYAEDYAAYRDVMAAKGDALDRIAGDLDDGLHLKEAAGRINRLLDGAWEFLAERRAVRDAHDAKEKAARMAAPTV